MGWIPPVIALWEKASSTSRLLTRLYALPYRQVIENEIRMGELGPDDIILNIGCGAIPFTAMYLATLADAAVYAVDIDPKAVEIARKCVKKAGLSHKITVLKQDGAAAFDRPFTASVVALQAAPKTRILDRMKQSSAPGAKFIFRLASAPYRDQYDAIDAGCPADRLVAQPMRTFDRSVLYRNAA